MLRGEDREKWKGRQPPEIEPRTLGLCSQCSVSEVRQLDNHQPSQSSVCSAQVELNCLSHTPGSHSVCAVRTWLGVNWKILSISKQPMLSGFSLSELRTHVGIREFRGLWEAHTEWLPGVQVRHFSMHTTLSVKSLVIMGESGINLRQSVNKCQLGWCF